MHVVEVGLRPSTQPITEPDGTRRASIMEAAGPPRWWAGRLGEDGTPVLTGQTITLDAGQRFLALDRDVQYLPLSGGPAKAPA